MRINSKSRCVIGTFLAICFFNPLTVSAKSVAWKLSLPYKPVGVYGEAARWLAVESKKRSNGQFTIEPYFTNALNINLTAPLSAVKDRLVELNLTHMSLTTPEEPLAGLPDLPFLKFSKAVRFLKPAKSNILPRGIEFHP